MEKFMSTIDLEQLAQSQKAGAQVLLTLARTAFHGLEQLSALNLAASRELFNTGTTGAQQLLGVRDPQQLRDVAASLARPNVDKLLEYSRSLYDLSANLQREVTTVLEEQYSEVRHNAAGLIEKSGATPDCRRRLRCSGEAVVERFEYGLREHFADGQAGDRHRRHECQGCFQRHRSSCCRADPEEVIRATDA
jgi:phasin family protein